MRILFLGDVMGRSGRDAVISRLPEIRKNLRIDYAIVNAENAAGGYGVTAKLVGEFFAAGANCLTMGNHSWDQKELVLQIDAMPNLLRPLNYPFGTPGQGYYLDRLPDGRSVLTISVIGRLFMDALVDDPFAAANQLLQKFALAQNGIAAIFVDFHGEASSEKMAFAHYLSGRISAVVGSHTHVPSADLQILPRGTAYQTDAGMCGDYHSVIGMKADQAVWKFTRKIPGERLQPAEGEATICGCLVETDDKTGLAQRIQPLRIGGHLAETWPE